MNLGRGIIVILFFTEVLTSFAFQTSLIAEPALPSEIQDHPNRLPTEIELSHFKKFLESELEKVEDQLRKIPITDHRPALSDKHSKRYFILNTATKTWVQIPAFAIVISSTFFTSLMANRIFHLPNSLLILFSAELATLSMVAVPIISTTLEKWKAKYHSSYEYVGSPSFDPIYGVPVPPNEFLQMNRLASQSQWRLDDIYEFLKLYPDWNTFFEKIEEFVTHFDRYKLHGLESKDPDLHTWAQDSLRPWLIRKAEREIFLSWKENLLEVLKNIRAQSISLSTSASVSLKKYPGTILDCVATVQSVGSITP